MTEKLQRPLLVGGLTLTIALWLLENLSHAFGEIGLYALLAGAIGLGVVWLQKPAAVVSPVPQRVDSTLVKRALSEAEALISQLVTEADDADGAAIVLEPQVSLLQSQVTQISSEMQRQTLRVLLMGGKGTGKTTLMQQLQALPSLSFSEAPSFSGRTEAGFVADTVALQQAIAADLVLFLITADPTASELKALEQVAARKRVVLVFNKQDQYAPSEQQTLLARMQEQVRGLKIPVVAIAAQPNPLRVRQHQPDGSIKEWLEAQAPNVVALTQELSQLVQQERQQLVLASSLACAQTLKAQVKMTLNDLRRDRALPVVEQFQWMSAATAFASPLPSVDVIATAAINAQMVMDLGKIYRQQFSLSQAQKVALTLGGLILKLGLVELSTRTIATLLKTNAMTYVAGGCVQGISAAYLTRVAGLSLIEYFHSQEPNLKEAEAQPLPIERLGQILQTVFEQNRQAAFLQSFVKQTIGRLMPAA
ncbi:MAG TPA: DUF697 domain-containing protein [Thermosynechococcaceae cyanobacterium]